MPITKSQPTGMVIDGCLSVETPDSSGEIVRIKGIDLSSFDVDGIYLNYEHVQPKDAEKEGPEKKEANGRELVGKLIYYKKIFSADDCENDRQRMYFDKYNGLPYLYGVFRLFDGAGHESAKALAAIIRDCVANDERIDLRYSVEGNTLDHDKQSKNILTDTIVRAIALTKRPCNKAAMSGLLLDPNAPKGFSTHPGEDKEDNDILADLLDNVKAEPHPLFRPIGSGVDVEINPMVVDATSRRGDLKKALSLLFKAKLVKAIMHETSLRKSQLQLPKVQPFPKLEEEPVDADGMIPHGFPVERKPPFTQRDISAARVESIPVAALIASQPKVYAPAMHGQAPLGDTPPVVVHQDGKYFISDGHHRAEHARRSGQTHIQARVVRPLGKSEEALEKGLHGDWESEGYRLAHTVDGDNINIQAFDRNNAKVGEMDAGRSTAYPGHLYPTMIKIHPSHQRKGIGTAMYVLAEKTLGQPFKRGIYQSPEAKAMWAQKNRPFGKSEPLSKALTAGGGEMGAPSSLTGGAALQPENLRSIKGRALGAIRDYPKWKTFNKDEFREVLKAALPEVDDSFLDHFVNVASDFNLKRAALRTGLKKAELEKVSLTPESTARQMRAHEPSRYTSYDRIETYPAGDDPFRPGGRLYQHVFYGEPIGSGYRPVMHVLSPDERPLYGMTYASSAAGLHDVQDHLNDPWHANQSKNLPWKDGEFIQHGETVSTAPGRGLGSILYSNMAKIHGRMTSDSSVSEGAEGVWRKLMNNPEFRGQLGPGKGHIHWVESLGPRPQPLRVWEGDGRSVENVLKEPSPYEVKLKKFPDQHPNREYLQAEVYHKGTGKRVGIRGIHVDHGTKRLYTQPNFRGGVNSWDFDHKDAPSVAMHAARTATGYSHGGDLPNEAQAVAKSELPSSVVCKLEALTIDLRKAAADLDEKKPEEKKVHFAGHHVVPGRATLADGEYELLHEGPSHYVARPSGKSEPEDLVRLSKAKELTHYIVHSKPHVLVMDLGK